MSYVGRFAPSSTGLPHFGTIFSACLAYQDARLNDGEFFVRLENLDRARCTVANERALVQAMAEVGVVWNDLIDQTVQQIHHAQALTELAIAKRLYPCRCSRKDIAARCKRAADGHYIYDGLCRPSVLGTLEWTSCEQAIRVALPEDTVSWNEFVRQQELVKNFHPLSEFGDPVVRRKNGEVCYQLAVVVDDAFSGVTNVVRGRDIAPATGLQVSLYNLLGLKTPKYRHHPLILAESKGKLSKSSRSMSWSELKLRYPKTLLDVLHLVCPTRNFSWDVVPALDQELVCGKKLLLRPV